MQQWCEGLSKESRKIISDYILYVITNAARYRASVGLVYYLMMRGAQEKLSSISEEELVKWFKKNRSYLSEVIWASPLNITRTQEIQALVIVCVWPKVIQAFYGHDNKHEEDGFIDSSTFVAQKINLRYSCADILKKATLPLTVIHPGSGQPKYIGLAKVLGLVTDKMENLQKDLDGFHPIYTATHKNIECENLSSKFYEMFLSPDMLDQWISYYSTSCKIEPLGPVITTQYALPLETED